MKTLNKVGLAVLAAAYVAVACGGDDGGGGSGTGGSSSGGGGTSAGGTSAGGTSAGGTSAGGTSAGGTSAGGTSAGGTSAGGTSAGGTSAGGTSAGGTSAGGTSAGGTSAGGTSAGGTSAGGTSAGGTSAGGTSAGGTGGGGGLDACGNAKGQLFPPGSIWNTPVDAAALDSESTTVINYLQQNHTAAEKFQIDFSIKVLTANASTPHKSFTKTNEFYNPDCDPAPPPVPTVGSLEGESGYACASNGDCHLLVIDTAECRLFEMWRANMTSSAFQGGCQVVWDLKTVYPANMRGDYCTSADAAGLPIAAHMFSADEVQAGAIEHAIRFILPNALMRANIYVHPATHSTGSTSGPSTAPPYGARMRLKASANISGLKPAAQVVAKALKKYGMILSDGGKVTFTGMGDTYTTAKWSQVGLTAQDLKSLKWSDFEMVAGGQRINWQAGSCAHVPITQ